MMECKIVTSKYLEDVRSTELVIIINGYYSLWIILVSRSNNLWLSSDHSNMGYNNICLKYRLF